MKNYVSLLLLFIVACNGNKKNQVAESNNITVVTESGESLFMSCIACHGQNGEGNKELEAPSIAGLDDWYIERQLTNFRKGIRGDTAIGTNAGQMTAVVNSLSSQEIEELADFVSQMEMVKTATTLEGDIKKGKQVYDMICGACHGPAGKGNKSLNAPKLTGQNDWYLLQQFNRFKDGSRGAHLEDTYGAQMAAMATTLPSEQSLNDVIVYLQSVGE